MAARLAVVTGASRGIGRALTERLTAAGQTVAAIGRSATDLDDVAAATGAIPFTLDVSDPAGVEDVFTRIVAELGVPGLTIAEEHGGLGLGIAELSLVMEAAGGALLCAPLLSSAVLGTALLQRAKIDDPDAVIEGIVWKRIRSFRVSITGGAGHDTEPKLSKLFEGYDGVVPGGNTSARRAEVVCFSNLRPWMRQFARKVRAAIDAEAS